MRGGEKEISQILAGFLRALTASAHAPDLAASSQHAEISPIQVVV